jgi:hypothetical protein
MDTERLRVTMRPLTAVLIVPTGIGAAIGGYAGDALPVARALATVCDRVITHPNVLNGAQLYWPIPNTFYVEGYGLDQFAAGHWGLQPVHQNRIGVILDAGIEPELRDRHLQALDAARATLGLALTDYVITDAPLGVALQTARSGASWGTIAHPESLLHAAEKLLLQAGADAIAVVARFPDDLDAAMLSRYRHGQGVDPLAGAEAVISHLIVRQFRVPCAHAPALSPLPVDPEVAPRSAAEELGYTFLPCVLAGLSRAPRFTTRRAFSLEQIWAEQVDAVIIPASAAGGSATMNLSDRVLIAVEENTTTLNVVPEMLRMRVQRVQSYWDAIGVLAAYKAGIDPAHLRPAIAPVSRKV